MINTTQEMTIEACLTKLRARLSTQNNGNGRHRFILGIIGAPGSGKSTFAQALMAGLAGQAIVAPMDGFHLANAELTRLHRRNRKGAEDTFDSAGYVALLKRLRDQAVDEIVYVPEFRREIEEPVAGAIAVLPTIQVVITEGNYLLLDHGHWAKVRGLLDEAWYLDIASDVRQERLIARHIRYGRDESAAQTWVRETDEPNAILIASTQARADMVFRLASAED